MLEVSSVCAAEILAGRQYQRGVLRIVIDPTSEICLLHPSGSMNSDVDYCEDISDCSGITRLVTRSYSLDEEQ